MATYTTEVEVDLDDFSDCELREELEYRGYYVSSDGFNNVEDLNDSELIDELQSRGYTIYGKLSDIPFELYQSYLLDNEKQFREHVKKLLIENGYKP